MLSIGSDLFFERNLVGIWISLKYSSVVAAGKRWTKGVFVGIEQNTLRVVVASAAIGEQLENVFAGQARSDSG